MADGDNLVIGTSNTGTATTFLDRSGTVRTAVILRNNNGHGLRVQLGGASPNAVAVSGEGGEGTGVLGLSLSQSTQTAGVEAVARAGSGVNAISTEGVGVEARSDQSFGVRGLGPQSGVYGWSKGDVGVGVTGLGVRGVAGFGTAIGVYGEHRSVGGLVTSGFQNVGVGGRSNAHHGVFGFCDAPLTPPMMVVGVAGQSQNDAGVAGECTGAMFGVLGRCHDNRAAGVVGRSRNGIGIHGSSVNGFAGTFDGDVFVDGNVWVSGGKSAVVPVADGSHRALYAVESPESWFEDFGVGRLVRGRARVRLARDFARLIRTAAYHVFLTPEGDSNGLYVTRKTTSGFEVLEQQAGRSSLPFSFRVVARRPDQRGKRLEKITVPKPLKGLDRRIVAPKPFSRPEAPPATTRPSIWDTRLRKRRAMRKTRSRIAKSARRS